MRRKNLTYLFPTTPFNLRKQYKQSLTYLSPNRKKLSCISLRTCKRSLTYASLPQPHSNNLEKKIHHMILMHNFFPPLIKAISTSSGKNLNLLHGLFLISTPWYLPPYFMDSSYSPSDFPHVENNSIHDFFLFSMISLSVSANAKRMHSLSEAEQGRFGNWFRVLKEIIRSILIRIRFVFLLVYTSIRR